MSDRGSRRRLQSKLLGYYCLLISEVLEVQLLLNSLPILPGPLPSLPCLTQCILSLSFPQELQAHPVVECKPGHIVRLGLSLDLNYLI